MKKKYIFVLCPPSHGSTIIINLIDSSPNVSSFLDAATWAGESQWLYGRHGDKDYKKNRWDPNYKLDMNVVNKVFELYLDSGKDIWLEKSPPTICRAKMFEDYFSKLGDVYFVISIRNPYAASRGAKDWVRHAEYQKWNIENLKNTIVISYEECCMDLDSVITKTKSKIPELVDIYNKPNSKKKGERFGKIHQNKVDRIKNKEEKNNILKDNIGILDFFGYKIID